jgi:phenylacetic acid degradation operon negative regulatory protein
MDITLTSRARKVKAQRAIFHLFFDYIEHFGGSIRIGSLIRLTSALGLTDNAARAAMCRLAKQGWLKRTTYTKHSFYALTPVAQERIKEALPRVFAPRNGHWDGQWTILTYSVPEKLRHYRSRLRRELTWLGYGQLTPATWINPHPVTDVTLRHLSIRKLDGYVHLFRARQVSGKPHSVLIESCFNLKAIEKNYRSFIETWSPFWDEQRARSAAGDSLPNSSCFALQRHLLYEYGNFLYMDPFLPNELLPVNWPGQEAWSLFRDFYFMLAPPALAFFESSFEGPPGREKDQMKDKQRLLDGTVARWGITSETSLSAIAR